MKNYNVLLVILVTTVLSGCASNRHWSPATDASRDPKPTTLAADTSHCEKVAREHTEKSGNTLDGMSPFSIMSAVSANTMSSFDTDKNGKRAYYGGQFDEYQRVYTYCLLSHGHVVY